MRHATVLTKRKKQVVYRSVVDAAIIDADDGDEESTTAEKYYAARNTAKHCFFRSSNLYFSFQIDSVRNLSLELY